MSSDYAINVSAVGKSFRMYDRPHHRLFQGLFAGEGKKWYREFQALQDVNLQVTHGETVGIVGKNGSGKSTLLQIICGTLQASYGDVLVHGRVAALLELGAGFNPEFTGRENVYLNGAVLGLTRREVSDRFDSIAHFADIGEFIEQPVKTYSSGMYIRLAFAVAINSDPKILVVDEALSVGDEAFQRKCFGRIEELKANGCTVLFVSHSAGTIVQLCDRAVLLDEGRILMTGRPKDVVAAYQRLLYAPAERRADMRRQLLERNESKGNVAAGRTDLDAVNLNAVNDDPTVRRARISVNDVSLAERYDAELKPASTVHYAENGARISEPHIVNAAGKRVNILVPGQLYSYRYTVEFDKPAFQVSFGMMIKSLTGVELFGMSSHADGEFISQVEAGRVFAIEFRFMSRFLPGAYFMNAGCNGRLENGSAGFLHRIVDADIFKIEQKATNRSKAGFYDLAAEPSCQFVEQGAATDVGVGFN
ncbi:MULTISPECIES: ABC transporter ATP-binding protein [unclassified Rhodanobacter]|uniref:ABC transporter ATP-binding protein n=1 Tax=Rhodanobacter humi TaxID=1888173 RepID=A0ABV4AUL6_9GAMM